MSVLWGCTSIWWGIAAAAVLYVVVVLFAQRAVRIIPRYRDRPALITEGTAAVLRERREKWLVEAAPRRVLWCCRLFLLIPPMLYRTLGVPRDDLREAARWATQVLRARGDYRGG